jgi:tripartite ATP-independent transporter DctM subunit
MSGISIGLTGLAGMMVLLLLRIPIAIALVVVSLLGLWALLDIGAAWSILRTVPFEFAASWTLSAVPMFLLMGYVAYHSGLTTSLFNLSKALIWRLPGSLAIASVLACSGFAAVCGSSIACAAAMGRIAIPEMVQTRYDKDFASGTIAAGGTIGALIPPSIVLLVFGVFTQTSVLDLFMGGIGVGLLTAASYIAVILIVSAVRPDIVPRTVEKPQGISVIGSLIETAPVLILIFVVFGGLFGGFFTATEAGAIGAAAAIAIAFATRRMNTKMLVGSIYETATTCAGLFIIAVGATMLTRFLSISGTGDFISGLFTGMDLEYWQLMLLITLIYLILGMFMDPLGAMLITLPIFLPIMQAEGLSLIWFGVYVTKLLETGMITPPFGLNVFVIKSVVGDMTSLAGIFRGVTFFIVADIVVVAAIIAWPEIVLFFPRVL